MNNFLTITRRTLIAPASLSIGLLSAATTAHASLESRLGGAVVTVAYPNGDFDPTVEATTRACGYKLAFTTQPGYASADMPPLVLPRMNIHETATDTKPLFLCRTLGIL